MKAPKNNKTDKIIDRLAQAAPTVDTILAVNGCPFPFASIISSCVQGFKPFNKNVENFLQYVSERLEYLFQNGIEVREKIESEEFISYLYLSLEGLKKNHQQDKLVMFKKIFDNYWMKPISYDIKTIYLDLLTNLSLSHIYILKSINEVGFEKLKTVKTKTDIYDVLKVESISLDIDSFRFILKDLSNRNLISISSDVSDVLLVKVTPSIITESSINIDKPMISLTGFAQNFVEYLIKE